MKLKEIARLYRKIIEQGVQSIDDETALKGAELFPHWSAGTTYGTGYRVQYEGKLYKCLNDHTAQEDWTPATAVSLWARVDDPAEEWPEWRQPSGAADAYSAGDKVSHAGKHWISDISENVWEPGVYGWRQAPGTETGEHDEE